VDLLGRFILAAMEALDLDAVELDGRKALRTPAVCGAWYKFRVLWYKFAKRWIKVAALGA